jgi:hypothetical protein
MILCNVLNPKLPIPGHDYQSFKSNVITDFDLQVTTFFWGGAAMTGHVERNKPPSGITLTITFIVTPTILGTLTSSRKVQEYWAEGTGVPR